LRLTIPESTVGSIGPAHLGQVVDTVLPYPRGYPSA
jgi:hypothetical protein